MTNQDKLPAKATGTNVSVRTEQSGGLVTRGLEAIETRQEQLVSIAIEAESEKLPQDVADLLRAAEQGDANAQYDLGEVYYYGGDSLSANIVEALKWWRKAAEQGNGDAQYQLGCAYSEGEGVPKDYVQAYMWFDLACWSGETHTLWNPMQEQQREDIAGFITTDQIGQARRLAIEMARKFMTSDGITESLAIDEANTCSLKNKNLLA
jgi:hypothetical protein